VNVVFLPVARNNLVKALVEGHGDVAAANLTITPERMTRVDFSAPLFSNIKEIVVTGRGAPPLSRAEDLSGKEVYVRKSSSFYDSLQILNKKLKKLGKEPVKIRYAPEELETEDILEMVNAGLVDITIADSHIAEFWKKIFENITLHPEAAVKTGRHIGMMLRKNSPRLKSELNSFISLYPEGSKARNLLLFKYLKNTKYVREATSQEEMARFGSMAELFRKYGKEYDLDYLLSIAQGYQESRLDQSARSPAGAIGVMQLLESTGKEMNVGDIYQVEPNIHAGIKYVRFMINHYYAKEPMDSFNKALFAIASYDAGPNRLSRLRRRAGARGLDPNRWFGNVELIAAESLGRETVRYVSNIYKYYLAYKMVVEQEEIRKKVKSRLAGPFP
jgi:membrane-bound lytic murein transglycosylase MltF